MARARSRDAPELARARHADVVAASAAARRAERALRSHGNGSRTMNGLVSLVGAGTGDPELLTLKDVRRLAEADLVLYDALVSTDTLNFSLCARRCFAVQSAGPPAKSLDKL